MDLIEERRKKIVDVYNALPPATRGEGQLVTASPSESTRIVNEWTGNVGCNGVLEVRVINIWIALICLTVKQIVGNNPALSLAYDLIRPFGVIVSAGVHQAPPIPFTGRQLYNKNVAFEFGRCPVRTIFPMAVDLLRRRQDIFAGIGEPTSLIDRIMSIDEAPEAYKLFDKGEVGKVIFDPWLEKVKN